MSEVKSGFECGIGFDTFNDIKVGDVIEVLHDGAGGGSDRMRPPALTIAD